MSEQYPFWESKTSETAHLIVRDSSIHELERLQAINEASDYIENWVGWKTPKNYALKTLTEGNLPPGGVRDNFRAKTVCLKETSEAIGVLEAYCGYPSPEVLWLGWLFILPEHQKHGYAREVVKLLASEAENSGFTKLRLGVALKNWPALRFWHRQGFDRIVQFSGDEISGVAAFANVMLERALGAAAAAN